MDYPNASGGRHGDKLPPVSELKFDSPEPHRPAPPPTFAFGSHQALPPGPAISSASPTSQEPSYSGMDNRRDMPSRYSPKLPGTMSGGYMSPPNSRRTSGSGDGDERRGGPSIPVRQSLPSLSEALRDQLPPPGPPAHPHSTLNPSPYHSHIPPPLPPQFRPGDSPHSSNLLPVSGDPSMRASEPAYRTPPPGGYPEDVYGRGGPPPFANGHPSQPYPSDRGPPPYGGYPPNHYQSPQPTSYPHQYQHSESSFKVLGKRTERYGPIIERTLAVSSVSRDVEKLREGVKIVSMVVDTYSESNRVPEEPGRLKKDLLTAQHELDKMTIAVKSALETIDHLGVSEKGDGLHTVNQGNMSYYEEGRKYAQPAEPKRMRRGRPAPPGRCHSCNRSETPEWRRGPDGARTLCNACGLHFAKISRKNSKNLQAAATAANNNNNNNP